MHPNYEEVSIIQAVGIDFYRRQNYLMVFFFVCVGIDLHNLETLYLGPNYLLIFGTTIS